MTGLHKPQTGASPWLWMAGARLLLAVLGALWLLLALWIGFGGEVGLPPQSALRRLAGLGLLGDAAAHGLAAWGLPRRPVLFGLLGAGLLLANAALILLDQAGACEVGLALLHLGGLGILWKAVRPGKQRGA